MAWGRREPHTVEVGNPSDGPERIDMDQQTVADTERLGIDPEVAERPAHAWEVGEADSWEPAVPDTWVPPTDDEATWTDAARADPEWEQAGAEADESTAAAERADDAERTHEPAGPTPRAEPMGPARMALGLASLAAQRMRAGVPAGDGLVTGFGLMRQTANGLLALGQRLLEPVSRVAEGAVHTAARLPVAGLPVRAALRSRQWLIRSGAEAREKLSAAMAESGTSTAEEAGTARSRR